MLLLYMHCIDAVVTLGKRDACSFCNLIVADVEKNAKRRKLLIPNTEKEI